MRKWPTEKGKMESFIKSRKCPDETSNWMEFPVTIRAWCSELPFIN